MEQAEQNIPKVIYEKDDYLAIVKPPHWIVHQPKHAHSKKELVLCDWLVRYFPQIKKVGDDPENRPGIVHRLDQETSGIMLIAKTQKGFDYLKNLFKEHLIQKKYLALVSGELKEKKGAIDRPIGIVDGSTRRSIHSKKMSKPALTEYQVLRVIEIVGKKYSLLEVMPKTGRTHQIRVHLKSIGHPIVGDLLYKGENWRDGRLRLHANSLEFKEEDGKSIRLEAEMPTDFL